MPPAPRHPYLAPLLVAAIWGINVPVMKASLQELDPFVFNAARLTLSVLALGVVDALERRGRPAAPVRWRTVIWIGLLSSFAYQLLFLWGMDNTTASNTALIIASGPLWTAVLSSLYGLEKQTTRGLFSLGVAFVGTLLVTASGVRPGAGNGAGGLLLGNLAVLLSMITWAWATVLSRPILETVPATRLAYLMTLVALPGHWLIALPRIGEQSTDRWIFLSAAIVFSGVLSTGIAYALWNRSVRVLGPARTSMFSYLVPVVALIAGWIYLSDQPSGIQLTGGALVIGGLLLRRRRAPRP